MPAAVKLTVIMNTVQRVVVAAEIKNKAFENWPGYISNGGVIMINHADRAEAFFKDGYNCAQSVFAAFQDELGLDIDTALKIASSFGGGMGRLREVCGALTGLFMVAGIKYGYSDPEDQGSKSEHYQLIQNLAIRFKDQYGSIICRDLLQLDEQTSDPTPEIRTEQYYQRRPCIEYVRMAASLLNDEKNLPEK